MIPARIADTTVVIGEPIGWDKDRDGPCAGLPIRISMSEGHPIMESAWEPTPAELAALNNGGKVYLRVVGSSHPPVMLYALGPGEQEAE